MKHSLASIALGAILLSQSVLAGLYSPRDGVVELNAKNFKAEVMDSNHVVMVEFYAPWCGHCKNLAPQYKTAAKNLAGIARLAAIDCDDENNKPICGQYGIKGFPTIKVFKANKFAKGVKYPKDYNGERSAKAMVDHLVGLLPDNIKLVSANPTSTVDKITNIDEFAAMENEPRVLLFSHKSTSSIMYKGLATEFLDRMVVAEFRKPTEDLLKRFKQTNTPSLVVFPKGSQEPVAYSGELKREPITEFLNSYAEQPKTAGSDNTDNTPPPPVVEFNPNVPQITEQSQLKEECLDKPRGHCVVAFLIVEPEFPESVQAHEENLELLRNVKKAAHDAKRLLHVVWMDVLDKRVSDFKDKFQLSSDIPGLMLLSPVKKAFSPFLGQFDLQGIQQWLKDTDAGRSRVFPYTFNVELEAPKAKPVKDEL